MAGNGKETDERIAPPYLPFATFRSFIENLNNTALPPRIDNSIMPTFSGGLKVQMRAALRFLGLIGGDGAVTPALAELVRTYGTPEWKEAVAEFVTTKYVDVVGDLDIDKATYQQLREQFQSVSGLESSALDKAVRFYLAALDEAGLTYSPFFKTRGARSSAARKPRVIAAPRRASNGGEAAFQPSVPKGSEKIEVAIRGKSPVTLVVPSDLDEKEWRNTDLFVRNYFGFKGK